MACFGIDGREIRNYQPDQQRNHLQYAPKWQSKTEDMRVTPPSSAFIRMCGAPTQRVRVRVMVQGERR